MSRGGDLEGVGSVIAGSFGCESGPCPACKRRSTWLRVGRDLRCLCDCQATEAQKAEVERARARSQAASARENLSRKARIALASRATKCHFGQLQAHGRCTLDRIHPECAACPVTGFLRGDDNPEPPATAETRTP